MKLSDLPDFIYNGDDDDRKFFLTINRNIDGRWTAGYTELDGFSSIFPINDADTLPEVATRLHAYLKRNNKV
jgi:hypothetical protein